MPNRDGTGPIGQGPRVGRGLGICGRPRINRKVQFFPNVTYFKPAGIPLRDLEEVEISADELEALRLQNLLNLDQKQVAKKMNISQPTIHRTLIQTKKKITDALINGKAIKIIKQ